MTYFGIRPATVSVLLEDYKGALAKIADLEKPEEICAIKCVDCCFYYGNFKNHELKEQQKVQLFFDQGEPFLGHLHDRRTNKQSRRINPIWAKVIHLGESDMRDVPALQASDLLAWSVNAKHKDGITREWQERVLSIDRDVEWFDYDRLTKPHRAGLEEIKGWKLPRRRSFR